MLITKCLDAHNLVAVWGLLLAEQKVLFLSAHTHVLTMACETLVSVLYPFRWEHVYVPVLPSRLANFLQAPVPFLVGATPDVIHATDEIPSDVVQVHLDNNTVILDQALYHKLRLPPRAKRKLLRKMQRVCRPPGPVHADRDSGNGGNGGDTAAAQSPRARHSHARRWMLRAPEKSRSKKVSQQWHSPTAL
uniref:UDENN domain-containing protein n=1 Tax=Diacronema lutheri TaxID=2081491 RepID=A0A7R9UNQ1_DIALT